MFETSPTPPSDERAPRRLSFRWTWDRSDWFIQCYRSDRIVIFDCGPLRVIWRRYPC